MFRLSWRNLLVNKLRLLLTVAAVTVGVSFVSGTFVLSDTMVKSFDELFSGISSGTDVIVRSKSPYDADVTTTGWDEASGRLALRLELEGAECPECVIPQPMLGELMLSAIQEHAPAVVAVDLEDPRDAE